MDHIVKTKSESDMISNMKVERKLILIIIS